MITRIAFRDVEGAEVYGYDARLLRQAGVSPYLHLCIFDRSGTAYLIDIAYSEKPKDNHWSLNYER